MDKATLQALHGAIQKWLKIARGEELDLGRRNCPLCQLMFKNFYGECYPWCPVAERTGWSGCCGTPYDDYHAWQPLADRKVAALAMVWFLCTLLPEDER